MSFDNLLLKLDEGLTHILGQWDIYSTTIAAVILVYFAYDVFSRADPDAHPMLLARQAQASPVRHEGESAVFRSHSSPHGMDLNSGLNVKDPGTSKWARGRDGDLRDIWNRAHDRKLDPEGKPTNEKGRILTVLGSEKIVEHALDHVQRQIAVIGSHLKQHGGDRVAIYLPNSIELLATIFASAFYGLTPILLPIDKSVENIGAFLKASKADSVVAGVGSFPFDAVTKQYPGLRNIVWVVDDGNKHLDWTEIPQGTGGSVNVSTWQTLLEDHKNGSELPESNPKEIPPSLLAVWSTGEGDVGKLVEYSQGNLVAAISAQIFSVPPNQRLTPSDLFLPADSLSSVYPLVLTLSALYSNASVALNSVAGEPADLALSTQGVAPTVIVASASTLLQLREKSRGRLTSLFFQIVHWFQTRTLTEQGVLPTVSMLSSFNDALKPSIGATPGKLRLVYVSERAQGGTPALNSQIISDLRIFLGARVIYALTAAPVAGAVAQTNIYDYRVDVTPSGRCSHFGAPVTSVEILLKDTKDRKTTDEESIGEIFVRGPAVVGGEAGLGVVGRIRDDFTLAYF